MLKFHYLSEIDGHPIATSPAPQTQAPVVTSIAPTVTTKAPIPSTAAPVVTTEPPMSSTVAAAVTTLSVVTQG